MNEVNTSLDRQTCRFLLEKPSKHVQEQTTFTVRAGLMANHIYSKRILLKPKQKQLLKI